MGTEQYSSYYTFQWKVSLSPLLFWVLIIIFQAIPVCHIQIMFKNQVVLNRAGMSLHPNTGETRVTWVFLQFPRLPEWCSSYWWGALWSEPDYLWRPALPRIQAHSTTAILEYTLFSSFCVCLEFALFHFLANSHSLFWGKSHPRSVWCPRPANVPPVAVEGLLWISHWGLSWQTCCSPCKAASSSGVSFRRVGAGPEVLRVPGTVRFTAPA